MLEHTLNIFFLLSIGKALQLGKIPNISIVQCDETDLCLNVNFMDNAEDERILLDEVRVLHEVVSCVYNGEFEATDVYATASFMDCPANESEWLEVPIYPTFKSNNNNNEMFNRLLSTIPDRIISCFTKSISLLE